MAMAPGFADPPRQRDLAAAAGVSAATVSRALNNDPRLSEATRARVQRIAADLGYRPDPLLSALAHYRRRPRSGPLQPAMAYLRRARPQKRPYRAYHAELLRGAQEYAARYGYTVDYLPYGAPGDRALDRVLGARGVRGLLIEPIFPEDAALRLDLKGYAVVVVDNPFFSSDFDRVAFDCYGAGKEAYTECRRRGHLRPGLLLSAVADRNGEQKTRAGFLIRQGETGAASLPPLILDDWDATAFRRWLRLHRVDAVITSQAFILPVRHVLADLGLSVPKDIGLLNTNIHELPPDASGIYHDNAAIGACAAELLIAKLARHEFGPSPHARVISQRGRWMEGGTLRDRPPEPPAATRRSRSDPGPAAIPPR